MSADADAPVREELAKVDDYDAMLNRVESAIDEVVEKIESGRIRDESKERARQGWHRVLANHLAEWRKMKEARDLEELRQDVEDLKEEREQKERVRA